MSWWRGYGASLCWLPAVLVFGFLISGLELKCWLISEKVRSSSKCPLYLLVNGLVYQFERVVSPHPVLCWKRDWGARLLEHQIWRTSSLLVGISAHQEKKLFSACLCGCYGEICQRFRPSSWSYFARSSNLWTSLKLLLAPHCLARSTWPKLVLAIRRRSSTLHFSLPVCWRTVCRGRHRCLRCRRMWLGL